MPSQDRAAVTKRRPSPSEAGTALTETSTCASARSRAFQILSPGDFHRNHDKRLLRQPREVVRDGA